MTKRKSTSLLCGLALALPLSASAQLFVDGFDTAGSSSSWDVQMANADNQADFGWDYSALGIPSAPNGSGTTGVRMASNITGGATTGLSMTPVGVALPTNYTVSFDMWMNVNGPFPGGGSGSTEFATFGIGATGSEVQWSGAGGQTLGVSGEGGSSADYRFYGTGSLAAGANHADIYYTAAFPGQTAPALQQTNYAQQNELPLSDGTLGFAWREVSIEVTGATATWTVDGTLLATVNDFDGNGNAFLGYYDAFNSLSDNPDLSFVVYDNFQVIPEPSTYALFAGLGILGLAVWRRSRKTAA